MQLSGMGDTEPRSKGGEGVSHVETAFRSKQRASQVKVLQQGGSVLSVNWDQHGERWLQQHGEGTGAGYEARGPGPEGLGGQCGSGLWLLLWMNWEAHRKVSSKGMT